jgi:hypothetical protein
MHDNRLASAASLPRVANVPSFSDALSIGESIIAKEVQKVRLRLLSIGAVKKGCMLHRFTGVRMGKSDARRPALDQIAFSSSPSYVLSSLNWPSSKIPKFALLATRVHAKYIRPFCGAKGR